MILVTGATSAVGLAVIKELLARQVAVRAFVRKQADVTRFEAQGVEAFLGDMREPESVARALQGLAGMYLIAPAGEHLAVIERLWIEEARKAGLPHLVKQSEIGADPRSLV